ncbi:MAG: PBSX family phage terminase large subunit [Bacteroidia bacterium]|nr:PBSX family phage terminase large subunit [Bacteroidia bacterium]
MITEKTTDVEFNPHFEGFFNESCRYQVLYGGSGSGKSFGIAQKIVMRCLKGKTRILVVRKFKSTIRHSVFDLIKNVLLRYDLKRYADVIKSELAFVFTNGSEIITSGLDDPEKIKSIFDIDVIWIEEATELEKLDFYQLDLRLRGGDVKKEFIFSFNPISEDHWLKKEFFEEKKDNVFILQSNFEHNLYIDEDYKKALRERYSYDENYNRIYVEGQWGRITTGSEFYSHFKFSKHIRELKFNYQNPIIHVSFDFNVNPYMPCSIWQIEPTGDIMKPIYFARCIDEIVLFHPNNKTEDVCNEVIKRYGNSIKQIFFYGDASGRTRSTHSREHNYDIIKRIFRPFLSNYSDRSCRKNPSVAKRRIFINAIFAEQLPIIIEINKLNKYIIGDMENVLESADGGKYVKLGKDPVSGVPFQKYGHLADTMDYLLTMAFKGYFR